MANNVSDVRGGADAQVPKPKDLGEHRLTKFEGELRAKLPDWYSEITGIRNGFRTGTASS